MEYRLKKEIYSPFDISKVCAVHSETVSKWLDEGSLGFFQVPGGHRRIHHSSLIQFLESDHRNIQPRWEKILKHYRVLVIEDEVDLLQIIRDLLRIELGVEVRTEENGYHGSLLCEGWYPDLVILDYLIPGMDGFEVCKRVRGNPNTHDIPVLALTCLANRGKREAVLASGVSDCLAKPFQSDELIKKIKCILGVDFKAVDPPVHS